MLTSHPRSEENAASERSPIPSTASGIALRDLWIGLRTGDLRIADAFDTDTHHHLLLVAPGDQFAAPPPSFEVLEAVLASGSKGAALDLGLALSTVAAKVHSCLASMGLDAHASRLPPLLMIAYVADRQASTARVQVVASNGKAHVALQRCDERFKSLLPPGEFAVLRSLVDGLSHAAIAAKRGTSVRTIANQIAAVFHRLGVSGRTELLARLVSEALSMAEHTAQGTLVSPHISDLQLEKARLKLSEFKEALTEVKTAARGTKHEVPLEFLDAQIVAFERQIAALESSMSDGKTKVGSIRPAS